MKGKLKGLPILILLLILIPALAIALVERVNLEASEDDISVLSEEDYHYDFTYQDTTPVISEEKTMINPYQDSTVTIGKSYYDYQGEEKEQQDSLIVQDNTYYQNTGIDYTSENIFDVVAVQKGTVVLTKEDDNVGKVVQIEHEDGLISIYQSLSEISIQKGDVVEQGQVIGKSGTNEMDKELGNHLHFEMYKNGNSVNPADYLNKEYQKEN